MNIAAYVEINVFCVFIIGLIYVNLSKVTYPSLDQKLFRYLLGVTVVFCVADLGSYLTNGDVVFRNGAACWIFNMIYFISACVLSFLWLLYSVVRVTNSSLVVKDRAFLYGIPVAVFAMLVLTSPWTHLIFYIDRHGIYHRGSGVVLHWLIGWGYLLIMNIFCLYHARKETLSIRRKELHLLSLLCIPPVLASVLQILFPGTTIIGVGMTAAILIAFITLQNRQISRDALTGTNNRRQMEIYLTDKIRESKPEDTVFLMILDVDDFKIINDSFGHVTGDHALVDVAKCLKQVCGRMNRDLFLARYGGDEFAIVGFGKAEEIVPIVTQEIDREVRLLNQSANEPYHISISFGHVVGQCKDFRHAERLLEMADQQMYQNKKSKKKTK